MKTEKTIGTLLIIGSIGVLVPYTLLTVLFDYPNILREETGIILTKFHAGGSQLVWTWWAFAILGLPLVVAYNMIGQKFENQVPFVRAATTLGIIGLVAQLVGLLRWTFVVPVLAEQFTSGNEIAKEATKVSFQLIHQFGGVVLGEHIGQLFTIAWTVMMTAAFVRIKQFPKWVNWLGYGASLTYLLAQAELFATVIPNFPAWDLAGFIGSTLWLIWLIVIGILFVQKTSKNNAPFSLP